MGKIKGLILSQFHEIKGLTIIIAVPDNILISPSQFSLYSELILPREELCGRLLVLEFMQNYYIVGVPSLSVNTPQKTVYFRSKYIYSVNILISKADYLKEAGKPLYKQIARKLSQFFKFVEETSNTIYDNENNKIYLKTILEKAFNEINNQSQCVLSHYASCYTIINLNTPPYHRTKKPIKKSNVPVTFLTEAQIEDIQSEFGRKLLNYAKRGDFNIKKICKKVENEEEVLNYYQKAVEMGIVCMLDMFCLENRYCLTPVFHEYLQLKDQRQLSLICESVKVNKDSRVSIDDLFKLYFQICRKNNIRKIIDSNLKIVSQIDVVKWIKISQILGIIKRIEEKFAVVGEEGQEFEFISEAQIRKHIEKRKSKLNQYSINVMEEHERLNSLFSSHLKNMECIDQICVSLEIDKKTLFKLLNFDRQTILKIYYVSE